MYAFDFDLTSSVKFLIRYIIFLFKPKLLEANALCNQSNHVLWIRSDSLNIWIKFVEHFDFFILTSCSVLLKNLQKFFVKVDRKKNIRTFFIHHFSKKFRENHFMSILSECSENSDWSLFTLVSISFLEHFTWIFRKFSLIAYR